MSDAPDDPVSYAVNRKARPGSLKVRRLPVTFTNDIRRVITRFFDPGGEARIHNLLERIRGLSGGQVDQLLDEVLLKFRARHGNIASVLDENYRTAMAMIGMADDLSHNRRLLIGVLLDRRVLDRVGGALQPVHRPAPQPAEPSRRRGAVHNEPPRHGRGARVVDRLPHRPHHCRSPHPNRPLRTPRQAHPRCSRQAIRQALVSAEAQRHRCSRRGRGSRAGPRRRLFHLGASSSAPSSRRAMRHPRSFPWRNRSRTSAGWPNRTISWSFHAKRRRPKW